MANVEISIRARAHGPTGTAHRLHTEVMALLESLGYAIDGPLHVRVDTAESAGTTDPLGRSLVKFGDPMRELGDPSSDDPTGSGIFALPYTESNDSVPNSLPPRSMRPFGREIS